MRQIDQVKKWLGNEWSTSIYSLNTAGSKFYYYTFYTRTAWDGEFSTWRDADDDYKHCIDLTTGAQLF